MSARNQKRSGAVGALVGMVGFSAIAGLLATVAVAPAVAVTGMTANTTISIFDDLPNYIEINAQNQRNTIWANRDGQPVQVATLFSQNREVVGNDQVSDYAKWAAVSGEDRNFYEHGGVDAARVVAAAARNVAAGGISSGASTLTMQLVKNIFVMQSLEIDDPEERQAAYDDATDSDGFDRKLREMRYAISLEKKYSKDEILLAYLNIAYYGDQTYGIEAAAQQYYNTTAAKLTPAQAASLVAIVQYPGLRSLDDPEHYEPNQQRRDQILGRMLQDGHIDQAQYDEAIATPVDSSTVTLTQATEGCTSAIDYGRLVCQYVNRYMLAGNVQSMGSSVDDRIANWNRGGYDIYTSIDLGLVEVAQDAVLLADPFTPQGMQLGASTASVEVGTGRVLQIAQNKEYAQVADRADNQTELNFAVDNQYGSGNGYQPGSTMKPFTLLAWLKAGRGLNEVVPVSERSYRASEFTSSCWNPVGYGDTLQNDANEGGSRTVLNATANSINNGFFYMASQVDLCDIRTIAEEFGVHSSDGGGIDTEDNLGWLIGGSKLEVSPLTMAASYAGIANGGIYCSPIVVDRIVGPGGSDLAGETPACTQTSITKDVADAAITALEGAVRGYAGYPADFFGKTGTTNLYEDQWIDTANSRVATSQWVGNLNREGTRYDMRRVYSNGYLASQLRHVMNRRVQQYIATNYSGEAFDEPERSFYTGDDRNSIEIPASLIGTNAQGAQAALAALGLTFVDGGAVDNSAPAGTVVTTNPAPGTRVAPGTSVTVNTSNGVAQSTLPDVAGQRLQYDAAVARLAQAGFTDVEESCTEDPGQNGHVVSQSPSGGTIVDGDPSDTSITLTVARNSCGDE